MSENSSIEWTDATWNPVTGCTKISPGCAHCYAETFAERFRGVRGHPYEQGFDLKLWPDRLDLPLQWKRPRRIFVNSMSDLFHADVPADFISRVFDTMVHAGRHVFQVLTKRAERMQEWTSTYFTAETWPENVWLGVSVENNDHIWRIHHLQQTPARTRFLSVEPLLGPVALPPPVLQGIHWVIVGGESGPRARAMQREWLLSIKADCLASGVAFFFKQWGAHNEHGKRVGKQKAGRTLEGRTWDEMPFPGGSSTAFRETAPREIST
jgi:protein gp37